MSRVGSKLRMLPCGGQIYQPDSREVYIAIVMDICIMPLYVLGSKYPL